MSELVIWQVKVDGVWVLCGSKPEWEPGIEIREITVPDPDECAVYEEDE